MESPVKSIRKSQKESLLLREIAQLFNVIANEDPELKNLFVNRVALSDNGGMAEVYFYSSLGRDEFERVFQQLKLYKPSLRKAIADRVPGRYTPDIRFRFDDQLKKQLAIEELIEQVKEHDARYPHDDDSSSE
jgi:ribosome-binding factor A